MVVDRVTIGGRQCCIEFRECCLLDSESRQLQVGERSAPFRTGNVGWGTSRRDERKPNVLFVLVLVLLALVLILVLMVF
jgi:hypothetical protein